VILTWSLVLVLTTPARAEGFWQSYTDYWDQWFERIIDLDLYGLTAQLPQGVFAFKVEWNMRDAAGRFNAHRVRTPIIEPITFGGEEDPLLSLDLGASGGGGGITMQFSYGITDPLDFYFELPLQRMNVQMRPKLHKADPFVVALVGGADPNWFNPDGTVKERYANEAAAWFVDLLPELGRPALREPGDYPVDLGPGKEYDSGGYVLGDINLGFSWNYYRSRRWSGALTGRVYLPTGGLANPNNSLTLGTGPGLDRGTGAFGFSFTKGYDVKLYQYEHWVSIVVSAEVTAGYFFKTTRRYPDFPRPTDRGNRLLDLLDPERQYFPDMSDLTGKSYDYTPGLGVAAQGGISVGFLIFDVGCSVGYQFSQEPELNADWRFETMVKSLEMQAAGHYEIMRCAAGFNLLPLYVPLQVHYQYEKNIGGRNTLIFDNNHWITIQGYIPTY
jgi:hypothetical protein